MRPPFRPRGGAGLVGGAVLLAASFGVSFAVIFTALVLLQDVAARLPR